MSGPARSLRGNGALGSSRWANRTATCNYAGAAFRPLRCCSTNASCVQERKLGALDETQSTVQIDRRVVDAVDVQEGRLPGTQHAIDDSCGQCTGVAASARLGVCAYAAHLAQISCPHALTGHGDQSTILAHAHERAELDGSSAKRSRLGELHER